MADTKITALTALTAADPANDVIPIVDVSDTTMAASGTTKKISVNNILGASGTATLASASISGDLTARTTGLTVNSSGVGIGTNSQSSFLGNSPKKLVIGDGTQTPALTLYGGSTNVSGLYYAKGTVGNQAYRGYIEYDHNTDSFGLGVSGSLAMTLNSTGLGVGASPSYQLHVAKSQASQTAIYVDNQQNNAAASSALTLSAYGGFWNLSVPHSATFVNPLIFKFASTEMMRLDASGNLGIGVQPSAWGGGRKAIQIGSPANIVSASLTFEVGSNWWNDGTNYKYTSNNPVSLYAASNGLHAWYNAPTGTAGNNVTFTQAMTLDASGRLIVNSSTFVPPTLNTNGELNFIATSNTNVRFSYRGTDGVTRVANITLA